MSPEDRYLNRIANAYAPDENATGAGAGRGSYAGYSPAQAQYNTDITGSMKAIDPTMRQRLADFLQAGFEGIGVDRYKARKDAQTIMGGESSGAPLGMGIADLIPFLGTALQTEEAVIGGGKAIESAKQGDYVSAGIEGGAAAVGMIPGAVGTKQAVKSATKKIKAIKE